MFYQSEIQLIKYPLSLLLSENKLLIILPLICADAFIQFDLIILYLWMVC